MRSKIIALLWLLNLTHHHHLLAAKNPPENLTSSPPVTAKAWAIVDGKTGHYLWGFNSEELRKTASTTKMMCAYVVLQLAAKNPGILDETVVFSTLADSTTGSTAAIKAGESISVRDCLYGLMLPSGNDAGNALAEHFHARLLPPEKNSRADLTSTNFNTRRNFIAEMNRTAQQIGLTNTIYRSSFGDGGTDDDRTSTARDLLKMAWTAMQNPLFRQIVATPKHSCSARKADGTTRPVIWENSNQLLKIEGYDGIKTGTTTAAGTCVVASGHRGQDHLLLVVLGCESDLGRYVDARNLFRWAWQQRGHQ